MNIGMLLNAPYPSDVRVRKEASALIKAGHHVHLLCLRRKEEKFHTEEGGIKVTRIDAGKNNLQLAFWDAVMAISFLHPKFKRAIPPWVKQHNIQALHVHDLPLTGTALSLRSKLLIPVIADFHENYPDGLKVWFHQKKHPIVRLKNWLFMNPSVWARHEKKASRESDHVVAVVDEMKHRLIRDYHISAERITVVTNSEEQEFLRQPDDPLIYKAYGEKFIITYSGNIGPHRGVDTVIQAMQYISEYPSVVFLIVGSGNKESMTHLSQLVTKTNTQNNVIFLGRQPSERFYSFMKYADANIIPHKSNSHTDHTVPHKLFQAMMVGKPLIVSSSAPLKRIVSQTNSGVIFEAENPRDLAGKIIELYKNKTLQATLGENGKKATLQGNLNWEHDGKKLAGLYATLTQRHNTVLQHNN